MAETLHGSPPPPLPPPQIKEHASSTINRSSTSMEMTTDDVRKALAALKEQHEPQQETPSGRPDSVRASSVPARTAVVATSGADSAAVTAKRKKKPRRETKTSEERGGEGSRRMEAKNKVKRRRPPPSDQHYQQQQPAGLQTSEGFSNENDVAVAGETRPKRPSRRMKKPVDSNGATLSTDDARTRRRPSSRKKPPANAEASTEQEVNHTELTTKPSKPQKRLKKKKKRPSTTTTKSTDHALPETQEHDGNNLPQENVPVVEQEICRDEANGDTEASETFLDEPLPEDTEEAALVADGNNMGTPLNPKAAVSVSTEQEQPAASETSNTIPRNRSLKKKKSKTKVTSSPSSTSSSPEQETFNNILNEATPVKRKTKKRLKKKSAESSLKPINEDTAAAAATPMLLVDGNSETVRREPETPPLAIPDATMVALTEMFGAETVKATTGQEPPQKGSSLGASASSFHTVNLDGSDKGGNKCASDVELPASIPPKPSLDAEKDYQKLNNNSKPPSTTFADAKRQQQQGKSNGRAAPGDLRGDSPEQHPTATDALLVTAAAEDDLYEQVLQQHREREQLKRRKDSMKRCVWVLLGFLVAVGIYAIIHTFVFGWGGGGSNDSTGPFTMLPGLPQKTQDAIQNDAPSPQARAFEWLSQDSQRNSYPDWRLLQRFAAATMVFAFSKRSTAEVAAKDAWLLHEESECNWGNGDTDVCNDDGRVENLDLSSISGVQDDLVTSIPGEIALLKHLQRLAVPRNGIFVSWDGLLPSEIAQLAQTFRIMDVSQNELHHQIGSSSPLFHLSGLQLLDASVNHLTGTIPTELASLGWLVRLDLSRNRLTGPIPTQVTGLRDLRELILNGNELTQKIPTVVGSMISLERLNLGETSLTGLIPSQLGQLSNTLVSLDLSKTLLSGHLPSEVGLLGDRLQFLDLSSNALSGPLPVQIGHLKNLERLYLSLTAFTGSIPTEIGGLRSVQEIDISNSLLAGRLPFQLGKLTILRRLELAGSSFSGAIISEIGHLSRSLQWLDLSKNSFTGKIPVEMGQLKQLDHLDLSHNDLTGWIPADLFLLTGLEYLDLSNNFMTGRNPLDILQDLTALRILRFGGNYISGPIPTEIGLLSLLVELDLSSTAITGTIPSELALLTDLQVLKLSTNFLVGQLPAELAGLTSIRLVELHGTNITGNLPLGFCPAQGGSFVLSVNCEKVHCGSCDCNCLQ